MSLLISSAFANEDEARAILANMNAANLGNHQVHEGLGSPVVLVHGIDPTPLQEEWVKPISKLIDLEKDVYFYKWDKFKSLKDNQKLLVEELKTLLVESQDVTLIGYSAGGVIALMARDQLEGTEFESRVHLHTVASPIFGYSAPSSAVFGIPFVGSTTIEIGMGANKKLKHLRLNSCTHWVNTNCDLDKHACVNKKMFSPQSSLFAMPCGAEGTKYFNEEDHSSILLKAFETIF